MMAFCTNCGTKLETNQANCPQCGVATGAQPVPQPAGMPVSESPMPVAAVSEEGQTPAAYVPAGQTPGASPSPPAYAPAQPAYTPPVQPTYTPPVYGAPAYAPSYQAQPAGTLVSTIGYFGILLLFSLPLIGPVVCIIFACGGIKNLNLRNLARAMLIFMIIALVLSIGMYFAFKAVIDMVMAAYQDSMGSYGDMLGDLGELSALLKITFTPSMRAFLPFR